MEKRICFGSIEEIVLKNGLTMTQTRPECQDCDEFRDCLRHVRQKMKEEKEREELMKQKMITQIIDLSQMISNEMGSCLLEFLNRIYGSPLGAALFRNLILFWEVPNNILASSLTLPIIIIGGIYGGIFTPTEAAVVACVAGLAIGLFVHHEMTWRDLPKILSDSAKSTSMLMLIISMAMLFGYILTTELIPQKLSQAVLATSTEPWMVLVAINLILLGAGMFLEPTSIILVLGPLFYAVAMPLGISPIHLGIIITMNMEVGMITPPVGLNLYVASGISGMKLGQVARASLPWSLVLLLALLIVTYIPQISLWLPNMIWQ